MIIRCPQCEHSRSIPESKIPLTAELATCPRCKRRFRFRTLRSQPDTHLRPSGQEERKSYAPLENALSPAPKEPLHGHVGTLRPQSAFRESAAQTDVWDAVDALHHRWRNQMDQHVVEVDHPALSHQNDLEQPAAEVSKAVRTARSISEKTPSPHPASASGPDSCPAFRQAPQPDEERESLGHSLRQEEEQPEAPQAMPQDKAREPEQSAGPLRPEQDGPERFRRRVSAPAPDLLEPPPPMTDRESLENPLPEPVRSMSASSPQAVVFPYGSGKESAGNAEERVAQDIRMLNDASSTRPTRDLGRLKEGAEADQNDDQDDFSPDPDSNIPWENPARYGWAKGFMATVRGVMFQGPDFFSRFRASASLAPGYLFFLLLGYISILSSIAWSQAASALLPEAPPLLSHHLALPALLLLAPIALGLMLLFVIGCIRLGLRLFAPEKTEFTLIYKVVSYSVAPFVLSIVPFIGPPLGALWFVCALILGCRYAIGLSWNLAITMPLLPAAMLLGGLILYFL